MSVPVQLRLCVPSPATEIDLVPVLPDVCNDPNVAPAPEQVIAVIVPPPVVVSSAVTVPVTGECLYQPFPSTA